MFIGVGSRKLLRRQSSGCCRFHHDCGRVIILNTYIRFWQTESEQVIPLDSIKDAVRSSVKVPELEKHLKKAGGHIDRNVIEITMKTIVRKPFIIINKRLIFFSFFDKCKLWVFISILRLFNMVADKINVPVINGRFLLNFFWLWSANYVKFIWEWEMCWEKRLFVEKAFTNWLIIVFHNELESKRQSIERKTLVIFHRKRSENSGL